MNFFKILLFLEHGNRTVFGFPKEEQIAYLNLLGDAKDDIDRGYKQYLCQNQLVRPRSKIVIFNVAGALGLFFLLLFFLSKRLFSIRGKHIDCLIEKKGMPEVVPTEVREKYHPSEKYEVNLSLGFADLRFCWRLICRAPLHPYFVFKAMMNVARYSNLIYRYSPKTLIQFGEFSFSSSILTEYCHSYGVSHVDVMHGEKLFNIRDAYFHYDECYVWDEHYVKLFKAMKAEPTQFVVALPPSLKIDSEKNRNQAAYADYKYYLALYDEMTIKQIVESMAFAVNEGKSVKYRPHPRYSDLDMLKRYVKEEDIEWPKQVSIQESIANARWAVGSFTTVMVQAYLSGKGVIMDDVAEKKEYDLLRSLDYILSGDSFDRLSNHQEV